MTKLWRFGASTCAIGLLTYGILTPLDAIQIPPPPGAPLPGLTPAQIGLFNAGRDQFVQVETPATGLGPVFNGRSCLECHREPAPGGAGNDLLLTRVTRFGGTVAGIYSDLAQYGGAVVQRRSLRELDPSHPVNPEVVPPQAMFVSQRITTPLFGDGLMEAIPDATILALADPNDTNHDGISGRANMIFNPETNRIEVGKFGWKSQVSTLHFFAGDAYLNEMGITSPSFRHENPPQGRRMPIGADNVPDPEDENGADTTALTNFMKLLAPPAPRPLPPGHTGSQVFANLQCGSCHTPLLRSGESDIASIANKDVRLYSDLLLHDMGPGLADGIVQGSATGSEFRTAPLWGLGLRRFFLHDGRANNIDQAIRLHGGEASAIVQQYLSLSQQQRNLLLEFLGSL